MNFILIVLLLGSGTRTRAHTHTHAHTACGVERWPVKTLADPAAAKIRPAAQPITIEQLRQATPPTDLRSNPARHEIVEFTRYQIHALLVGYKQEADSDYHLVLASPANPKLTMIAEIPAGACVPAGLSQQEATLQAWVRRQFGAPLPNHRVRHLTHPKPVIVEGVGFFDYLHGQTGTSPNGLELHPVTSIVLEP